VRRCTEKEKNLHTSTALSDSVSKRSNLSLLHYDRSLILNCYNPQYKVIKFNGMTFKAGTLADSCCGLSCDAIVYIENVAYCTKQNVPVIIVTNSWKRKIYLMFPVYLPCLIFILFILYLI